MKVQPGTGQAVDQQCRLGGCAEMREQGPIMGYAHNGLSRQACTICTGFGDLRALGQELSAKSGGSGA